jgi:DNA-binding NarL/FixJ family response regulator
MSFTTNPGKKSVLIASGDQMVSAHYLRILETGYEVCSVISALDMLSSLRIKAPSILIIDPVIFPEHATDQILSVLRLAKDMHVIVVENSGNRSVNQHELFKAGVHGFCKDDIPEVLLRKAVQLVLDGDYWVQRKLITQVISDLAAENANSSTSNNFDRTLVRSLTPRELQVAHMVHMGGNNKTIARELDISERTVKAHLSAIFRKLEIENRLNLALYFSEID